MIGSGRGVQFKEFTVRSRLQAPPAEVWQGVGRMAGVNWELWPLVRMTHPPALDRFDPATFPIGRRAFRSWLLLGGVLPVDYDDLTFASLEPGRGFLERSCLLSARLWEHERTLEVTPGGCYLTDRVRFVPRVLGTGAALGPIYRAAFRYRHSRLRRRFGGGAAQVDGDCATRPR